MAQAKDDMLKSAVGLAVIVVVIVGLYYLLKPLFKGFHLPGIPGLGGGDGSGGPGNLTQSGKPSVFDKVGNQLSNVITEMQHPASQDNSAGMAAASAVGAQIGQAAVHAFDSTTGSISGLPGHDARAVVESQQGSSPNTCF